MWSAFRQAVGVGGLRAAEDRLSSILNAQIRETLGAGWCHIR